MLTLENHIDSMEKLVARYGVELDIYSWGKIKEIIHKCNDTKSSVLRSIMESAIRGFKFRDHQGLINSQHIHSIVRKSGEDFYVASWILRELPDADVILIFNKLFNTNIVTAEYPR